MVLFVRFRGFSMTYGEIPNKKILPRVILCLRCLTFPSTQRNVDDPSENARRHKQGVSERPLPVPRYFCFQRAVAKTNQKRQGEQGAANPINRPSLKMKKGTTTPRPRSSDSYNETDPGHPSPVPVPIRSLKPTWEPDPARPVSSFFRFDRLGRRPGARLHRAQEEIGHVIAEPDHWRVVIPPRLRRVAPRTLLAGRPVGQIVRASRLAVGRTGGGALARRAVTPRRGVGEFGGCGGWGSFLIRGGAALPADAERGGGANWGDVRPAGRGARDLQPPLGAPVADGRRHVRRVIVVPAGALLLPRPEAIARPLASRSCGR